MSEQCQCGTCRPVDFETDPGSVRMIVCGECGDKRCQKAANHKNACTRGLEIISQQSHSIGNVGVTFTVGRITK